jgi:hypothetical protein
MKGAVNDLAFSVPKQFQFHRFARDCFKSIACRGLRNKDAGALSRQVVVSLSSAMSITNRFYKSHQLLLQKLSGAINCCRWQADREITGQ